MAAQAELDDPLHNLRLSISASTPAILSTSDNPTDVTTSLANATHITFTAAPQHKAKTFALNTPTRFAPDNQPIDLRSVYFAWTKKDASLTDYIAGVQALNEELPSGAGGSVAQLSFAHRIEVIAWLNGETETSESIKPLEGAGLSVDAEKSAAIASGKAGGVAVDKGEKGKLDARLLVIYEGERKMGDQNSILRGSKPMDFSQYRTLAQSLYKPSRTGGTHHTTLPLPHPSTTNPLLPPTASKQRKRVEPIILLSPSASSLLRLSNIKSFLDTGVFVPANAPETAGAASGLNLLHLMRSLPSISSQAMRFILVDSTANFKPPYWDRVVAVFTTGQPWQFKSYKYTNPVELFAHYPGIYVGWQGDEVPGSVAGWGRGVMSVKVDKWTGRSEGRWRDREVVETIWGRIEAYMREKGWSQAGPGTAGGGRWWNGWVMEGRRGTEDDRIICAWDCIVSTTMSETGRISREEKRINKGLVFGRSLCRLGNIPVPRRISGMGMGLHSAGIPNIHHHVHHHVQLGQTSVLLWLKRPRPDRVISSI